MSKVTIDLDAPLYVFYKKGIIQALFQKGNPPPIYFQYYTVFLRCNKTANRTESVKLTADECGTSEITVWRAVKAIEGR
jgi:hypothetical protein